MRKEERSFEFFSSVLFCLNSLSPSLSVSLPLSFSLFCLDKQLLLKREDEKREREGQEIKRLEEEKTHFFLEKIILILSKKNPSADAVDFVSSAREGVAATITPQHITLSRNALFTGGIRPHNYCLPVLKRERHRIAVLSAATSGSPRFFLGTDSAPHAKNRKESSCGCAGIYSAPAALPLYAAAFEAAGKLERLEQFASFAGADFYGLPRNRDKVTLVKSKWRVPEEYSFGEEKDKGGEGANVVVPMGAGSELAWQVV